MGTANSMHVGDRSAGHGAAGQRARARQERQDVGRRAPTAARIVQMVWDDLRPRQMLTPGAFENAVVVILA